jgi:hypothetical protein
VIFRALQSLTFSGIGGGHVSAPGCLEVYVCGGGEAGGSSTLTAELARENSVDNAEDG